MEKKNAILQNRIDELELKNCEAQHKMEQLERKIILAKKIVEKYEPKITACLDNQMNTYSMLGSLNMVLVKGE